MEATAQWAQQKAVSTDDSFTAQIQSQLQEPWRHVDTRPKEGGTGIPYSTLFPLYLIEKLQPGTRDEDIIRRTWSAYEQNVSCGAMKPVIDSVLPANKSLSGIFPDYAETNYFLGYTVVDNQGTAKDLRDVLSAYLQKRSVTLPPDYRPLADGFDMIDQNLSITLPRGSQFGTIDPLGSVYGEFRNSFALKDQHRSLKIMVSIPMGNYVQPAVKAWKITQFPVSPNNVTVATPLQLVSQNGAWVGEIIISDFDASQVKRVAFEVTNPDARGVEQTISQYQITNWHVTGEILQPTPTPTNTVTPTPTVTPKFTTTSTNTPTLVPTP